MKTINNPSYNEASENKEAIEQKWNTLWEQLAKTNISVNEILDLDTNEYDTTEKLWKIFWKDMQAVNNIDYENNSPTKQLMNMFWIPENNENKFTVENVINQAFENDVKSYTDLHKDYVA